MAAVSAVRSGQTVSCARPLPTQPGPDNLNPVVHHMTGTATEGYGADYFALASHGYATSHIDALCHIFHEGRMYNGYSADDGYGARGGQARNPSSPIRSRHSGGLARHPLCTGC